MKRIGVLALQGAFIEHRQALLALETESFELRQRRDLERPMDGLILPGGESTAIGKLLKDLGMLHPLGRAIQGGLPVFGTCAGLILLAKKIQNDERRYLCTMDIRAVRNGYGRQLGSFLARAPFGRLGETPMQFIRAPYIESVGDGVEVLARLDDRIVAAREANMLVTAFHPELTGDLRVHRYFLEEIVGTSAKSRRAG